ncbi:hypothetical protein BBP40_004991 [Aspergillus hancockii]|nr:hypothetical protein BBP40_004991 [Aspergillus hancockii]
MGQTSPQPVDHDLSDHSEDIPQDKLEITDTRSKDTKAGRKSSSKAQSDVAATLKRKRKSNDHVQSSVAPSSPRDEEEPRPSKRKRIASPTKITQENRAEDDQTITGVVNSSPGTAQVNGGPLIESEHVSGSSTKSSSESNIQSPRKNEKKTKSSQESPKESTMTATPSVEPSDDATMEQGNVTKGKQSKEGKGSTGPFMAEEVQALERFKMEICNTHAISTSTFDSMVQHSERDKGTDFPCDSSVMTKQEFWKNIYEILPNRDRRSVYRFMRRHFQTSDVKPHKWDHEQDEELIQLVAQYGLKFAHIAKMIGRNDDDVVQRWKNKLQHRSTMNRGPWSEEEVRGLQNALQVAWKAFKKNGHDVGQDIYEMSETLISWGQISDKMGNCRSRQQCADKWRKARKKVMQLRDKGNPKAVYDPVAETTKKNRAKSQTVSRSQTPEGQYKSAKYVASDDEGSEEDVGERQKNNKKQKTLSTESGQKHVKSTHQKRNRSPEASTESPSEDSDSSSNSESPAHKRAAAKLRTKAQEEKNSNGSSSSENNSSDSSSSGSESEATSTSDPEKANSSKNVSSNTVKPKAQASSASEESSSGESEDDSESDDDGSNDSESESKPTSQSLRTGKACNVKRKGSNNTTSTSTSARSSISRDVKLEINSE